MGHPDGAHTHGGGGGFDPIPILIVLGAIAVAGPVMAAVAELVHVLLVIAVVVIGVGVAGLVALLAWRCRHRRLAAARAIAVPPRVVRAAQPLPGPRPAIERAPEVHVHHHWHGVTAEEVAEILRRQLL